MCDACCALLSDALSFDGGVGGGVRKAIDNVDPATFRNYRPPRGVDRDLGDLVVAMPYVQRWCQRENADLSDRLTEVSRCE